MVDYIQYTPKLCYDWKQTLIDVERYYPHQLKRTLDASTPSQLESKLWVVDELFKLPDSIERLRVALLGGWFANFITPLLIDNLNASMVFNYEIDNDVKDISYKYNKRYKDSNKYQCSIKDIMMKTLEDDFDIIINCSCEHMYPMTEFYEQSPQVDALYVLQSTDDDQYDDHINCVGSPEELAEQAHIIDVLYSGTKVLNSGMNRFMVIGYSA
tara:strand:+ start:218 stop:856 length:639 start_codon:yes stop_codon:yes gene_type:complete